MHFSTILAAATMALLSVVSAQSAPNPAMVACNTCMSNAVVAAVPACKGLVNSKPSSSTLTDKEKSCWCGLKSNKSWGDSCVGPDKCTAEMMLTIVQLFGAAATQPGACDNVSANSGAAAGNRFCGSSSVKVAAAGAAALAVAGALL
ncbi:hypothetical protein BKA57DRAFT_75602 [Linnemannia elongata]|nr:hypothetical protein BKA57DRAFT_75602 [Linnemannia elongata]